MFSTLLQTWQNTYKSAIFWCNHAIKMKILFRLLQVFVRTKLIFGLFLVFVMSTLLWYLFFVYLSVSHLVISDEFIQIHSNFDFSNFKLQIRMSNSVEFDLFDQIRWNLTSQLVKFDQIRLYLLTFIELCKCVDFEYAIFDQVEFVFIK